MGEQKRKMKPLSIVCFLLAAVLLAVSVFFLCFGQKPIKEKEQREPLDVYYATEQDEYVYLKMQYMTESVAYLEAVESMQYYITLDNDGNPAVICLYDSDLENYQPYIDWLYTEETKGGPEEILVRGYSVLFDDDLRQFVIENYNTVFGVDYLTEQNFEDYFGKCYLTLEQKGDSYENFNIGIYCLLGMVILIIIGVAISYQSLQEAAISGDGNYLEVHKTYKGRGVLGALLGALLGGVLWTAVGALGYISGWIGILIVLFAINGYKLFAREESIFGTVVGVVFSLLMVLPATYLAGVWTYYQNLNESLSEYITLKRAFQEFSQFLTRAEAWESMIYNIVMGYIFMIATGIRALYRSFMERGSKS